jgi:hypothetical protein
VSKARKVFVAHNEAQASLPFGAPRIAKAGEVLPQALISEHEKRALKLTIAHRSEHKHLS